LAGPSPEDTRQAIIESAARRVDGALSNAVWARYVPRLAHALIKFPSVDLRALAAQTG